MLITKCRSCKNGNLEPVLDLGEQPPSNSFLKTQDLTKLEKKYPLALLFCKDCFLLQLSCSVDPHELFSDYVYVSSTSRSLREHLGSLARTVFDYIKPKVDELVIDIGSNDGTLLKGYRGLTENILGIEPSSVADIAMAEGIRTHKAFFSTRTAGEVVERYGQAKIITATNVFAHIPDPDDFINGLNILLADDGVFVTEASYLPDLIEGNLFDTIYHEHIYYYSLLALDSLLKPRGFRAFHVDRFNFGPSGPPLRAYICKESAPFETRASVREFKAREMTLGLHKTPVYHAFAKRVWQIKEHLLALLTDLRKKGERIIGYGAPAKGNTILNTCGLDRQWLDAILEMNDLKVGLLTPGSHIPVVDERTFEMRGYNYALLLSWNLAREFLIHSPFIKKGGKFIVPLPQPSILS